MESEEATFHANRVWSLLSQACVDWSNDSFSAYAWPKGGASAVNRVGSRLQSSMTNQMSEALLYISINDQQSVKQRNLLKKLLSPGAKQVSPLLKTLRVQFKPFLWALLSKPISRSRKGRKLKKLLLKLLNLQITKQVMIRMILLSKVKTNISTKH